MDMHIAKDIVGLNQALYQVTHGLYVLTTAVGPRINGQCLDALMQVTNMPPRVAVGLGRRSLTHEMIAESGIFVVNVIDRQNESCYDTVRHFGFQSGRKVDKFATVPYELGELGAPILECAKAFFECRVLTEKTIDLGTHSLLIAEVIRAGVREGGEPLTYCEYRRAVKKNA